ncbi:MAG: TolC family protein [Candidatus Eisenbacteria bacterium]|uniref:TolC family protein n=1 Tax=Eiseniibacteriota bacterium TaxID=2212470 RepID=A0A948RWM7_UNCEI|nr:TolC family protein [Candidatus Eisenbacteria bacterium]MBU1948327.1 TolC family protein [Candidatus Eisenbacteria bacterium]MBU2692220.1 TolC family protein [Candidatus Eisenbacteria bacterium]
MKVKSSRNIISRSRIACVFGKSPSASTASARRFLAALLFMPVLLFLESPCDASYTLCEAVSRALEHNHNIAAKSHALDAAVWAHRQAKAQLFPSLSLQSSYTRLDDETVKRANSIGRELTFFYPDTAGNFQAETVEIPQTVFRNGFETQITAQMLLFHPTVWNGVAATGAIKDAAYWQEILTRQETAHQTVRAGIQLLKVYSLIEIQNEHLAQARENTALAERLFSVGRYSEADVLRWRVEEARRQGELAQQENLRRVNAMSLENLLGEPSGGFLELDDHLPQPILDQIDLFLGFDMNEWSDFESRPVNEIIENNPTLKILNNSVRISDLENQRSKTKLLPSLTLSGSYGWQNNNTLNLDGAKAWNASLVFSLPIFTSFSNYSEWQMTKRKVLQTREENEVAIRGLYLSAEAARSSIRSNTKLLLLAEATLESARRNLEIMHSNYTLGRLTNLEWIDANLTLQEAEQIHSAAYYDLVLAIADFFQSRGEILELFSGTGAEGVSH